MFQDVVEIDGAMGEGGGQIIRSSLALSLITGKAFTVTSIRARRKKPGLLRQHLTAVKAAAEVGGGKVEGAELGSLSLTFQPGTLRSGSYRFEVGTAGSATLVLQTILHPLVVTSGRSEIHLEGGTHNPFAPPFDFLDRVFLPLLREMGVNVQAELERPGFYPAGGGRFKVVIDPSRQLSEVDLLERGEVHRFIAVARVSNLPRRIAERELATLENKLDLNRDWLELEEVHNAAGPGNVVLVEIDSEHATELFTGFGQRGKRAEQVAGELASEVLHYLGSGVPVGPYLADQLLIPMALAGRGSFRTTTPTSHCLTNIAVIRAFLDTPVDVRDEPNGTSRITVGTVEQE